jgi:hypothetical protein
VFNGGELLFCSTFLRWTSKKFMFIARKLFHRRRPTIVVLSFVGAGVRKREIDYNLFNSVSYLRVIERDRWISVVPASPSRRRESKISNYHSETQTVCWR